MYIYIFLVGNLLPNRQVSANTFIGSKFALVVVFFHVIRFWNNPSTSTLLEEAFLFARSHNVQQWIWKFYQIDRLALSEKDEIVMKYILVHSYTDSQHSKVYLNPTLHCIF